MVRPDPCARSNHRLRRACHSLVRVARVSHLPIAASSSHSEALHAQLVEDLVRRGTDQCATALRKLSSRRLYEGQRGDGATSASGPVLARHDLQLEERGLRLDAVEAAVEDLVRGVRKLWRQADDGGASDAENGMPSSGREELDGSDGGGGWADDASKDDDHWVNPYSSQAPAAESPTAPSAPSDDDVAIHFEQLPLGEFDPHSHASRKRRVHSTLDRRSRSLRGAKRRTVASSSLGKPLHDEGTMSDSSDGENTLGIGTAVEERPAGRRNLSNTSRTSERAKAPSVSVHSRPASYTKQALEHHGTKKRSERGSRKSGSGRRQGVGRYASADAFGLLPSGFLDRSHDCPSRTDFQPESNADRLQRFLDANKEHDEESISSDVHMPLLSRQAEGIRRRQRPGSRRLGCNALDVAHGTHARASSTTRQAQLDVTRSTDEILDRVSKSYPSERSLRDVAVVVARFRNPSSDNALEVPRVFEALLGMIRKNRGETLLCVASRSITELRAHTRVLAAILELVRVGAHVSLKPENGLCYNLFCPTNHSHFIDAVLLQFVDLLHAIHLPAAWSFECPDREKVLRYLEPLRNAFAELLDPLQRISRCILKELEVQQWRVSQDERLVFVSSIDPQAWSDYLKNGSDRLSATTSSIRIESLGTVLPRSEVLAIGSILSFFAACTSLRTHHADQSDFWSLVKRLFDCCVFKTNKVDSTLPPTKSHLSATSVDVELLVGLLRSGSVVALPATDSFMARLLIRALTLQAEDVPYNGESVGQANDSSSEKTRRRSFRTRWKLCFSMSEAPLSEKVVLNTRALATMLSEGSPPRLQDGVVTLGPSTSLLRLCCELILEWMNLVPKKKARKSRLASTFKQIMAEVSNLRLEKVPMMATEQPDRFAAVFGSADVSSPSQSREGSKSMLAEAKLFLPFFFRVADSLSDNQTTINVRLLAVELWQSLANSATEGLTQDIGSYCFGLVNGISSAALSLSARAMTVLAFLALGLNPFTEDESATGIFYSFMPNSQIDEDCLVFLLNCLSSCLETACALSNSSDLVVSVSWFLGQFISRAQQLTAQPRLFELEDSLNKSIHHLMNRIPHLLIPVLRRCVDTLLCSASCGAIDDAPLESLLSLVRLSCGCAHVETKQSTVAECSFTSGCHTLSNSLGDSNSWGDLDDELFIGLDLPYGGAENSQDQPPQHDLVAYLQDCVEQVKPSSRFAVRVPTKFASAAKVLLARHVDKIAACMVSLCAIDSQNACERLLTAVSDSITTFSGVSSEDASFLKNYAHMVAIDLFILLDRSPTVEKAVFAVRNQVLAIALDSLLEVKSLKGLPSCNLSRIRARCGTNGERIEFALLMKHASHRKGLASFEYHKKLRQAFIFLGQCCIRKPDLGLVELGRGLTTEIIPIANDLLTPGSLESEMLNRFLLARTILETDALNRMELLVLLLRTGSQVIAELDQQVNGENRAAATGAQTDHRSAKRIESLHGYVCVHSTLLACAFRSCTASDYRHVPMLHRIGVSYVTRILQRKSVELDKNWERILDPTISLLEIDFPSGPAKAAFADVYVPYLFRRCREFLSLWAMEFTRSGDRCPGTLFDAFLQAAVEGDDHCAWLFCRSFASEPMIHCYAREEELDSSPLQSAIDLTLQHLDSAASRQAQPFDSQVHLRLKRYLLKSVIAPRLCLNQAESAKKGLLRLLQYLLEMESRERAAVNDDGPRMEVFLLCGVTRGLRLTLQNTLAGMMTNEDLLVSTYQCAQAFAMIPAASVDHGAVGWLKDWCSESHAEGATYLQALFEWLRNLGEMLLETPSDLSSIGSCVATFKALKANNWDAEATTMIRQPLLHPSVASWLRLVELEGQVFPVRQNARTVLNVYASSKHGSLQHEKAIEANGWVPSPTLRRVVLGFLVKVRSSDSPGVATRTSTIVP